MILLQFLLLWVSSSVHAQELNDVSILVPLPSLSEFSQMLEPKSSGVRGELLSHEVFKIFPVLTNDASQDSIYEYNLKVVGIRLDPCFREGSETTCRRQIRMVWQPLIEARDGSGGTKTSTIDAAVHTFYQFKEGEWKNLYSEWMTLAAEGTKMKSGIPLQINPRLKKEGFSGNYWKKLRALLLKYCGDQTLIRATVSTVNMNRVWNFMGFDRDAEGKWSYIQIPLIHRNSQSFFLSFDGLFELSEFNGGFGPVPPGQDLWYRLFSDSKKFRETKTEAELKLVLNRANDLENPRIHNPGTADCVSCHLAQSVRLWSENKPVATNRVRAFGYFDDEPVFSQRVVNETATIVQSLRQKR